LIAEFIKKWEEGNEVVIGVRSGRDQGCFIKNIFSWFFYKLYNSIATTKVVPRSTDFRLLDRLVIDEFNRFTERNRMTRGLIAWLGFKRNYIYFEAQKRKFGKPRYSYPKLMKLAMSSFIANSLFPLKFAGYLGVSITLISGIVGFVVLVEQFIFKDPWKFNFSGTAILAIIILVLVGVILCCFGLVALYIANIHSEVVNRPIYVIRGKKL